MRLTLTNDQGDVWVVINRDATGRWIADDSSNDGELLADSDREMFGTDRLRTVMPDLIDEAVQWEELTNRAREGG